MRFCEGGFIFVDFEAADVVVRTLVVVALAFEPGVGDGFWFVPQSHFCNIMEQVQKLSFIVRFEDLECIFA